MLLLLLLLTKGPPYPMRERVIISSAHAMLTERDITWLRMQLRFQDPLFSHLPELHRAESLVLAAPHSGNTRSIMPGAVERKREDRVVNLYACQV